MRSTWAKSLIMLFAATASTAFLAADDPKAPALIKLDRARGEYEKKTTRLKDLITKRFNDLERAARKAGNDELTKRVVKERAEFENEGLTPDVIRADDYLVELKKARAALGVAIFDAKVHFEKANDAAGKEAVERELAELEAGKPVGGVALDVRMSPSGKFVPPITATEQAEWRVGDPGGLKVERDGVLLGTRRGGNFLVTKNQDLRRGTIQCEIAAERGTEAFLGMRMFVDDAGVWHGGTSRIFEDEGRIWMGKCGTDFNANEDPRYSRKELEYGEFAKVLFEINDEGLMHVYTNGERTGVAGVPAAWRRGEVGIFVKSGAIKIRNFVVTK
jgi:hypothetical protein